MVGAMIMTAMDSREGQTVLPFRRENILFPEMGDHEEISDSQLQADVAARKANVASLLAGKNKAGALAACLTDPPVHAKNNDIKVGYVLVLVFFYYLIIGFYLP